MSADMVALEKLEAELQLDIERLAELRSTNERAAERIAVGDSDELEYAALGYTIHNLFR